MSENPAEETPQIDYPIHYEPKPAVLRKGAERIEVGHAAITQQGAGLVTIEITLDTHAGIEMASFLASNLCTAISIGGLLDPEAANKILGNN